jgi:hypothetical protein
MGRDDPRRCHRTIPAKTDSYSELKTLNDEIIGIGAVFIEEGANSTKSRVEIPLYPANLALVMIFPAHAEHDRSGS